MDTYTFSERTKSQTIVTLIAALWASLVAAYLYFAATYDRSVVFFGPEMSRFQVARNNVIDYAGAVSVTGPGSAFGLTIPVFLALSSLAVRKHRRGASLVAGGLTLGVCLLWPLSIGVLYLPAALLLLLAGARTHADPAPAI